jgi:hypothetical protein
MLGHPGRGTGFDGNGLGRHLLRLHRRPARLFLVGICRDRNVLGFVFVHPAAVFGRSVWLGMAGVQFAAAKMQKRKKGIDTTNMSF